MIVLHGRWDDGLALWGEDPARWGDGSAPTRRGRQIPAHPFAVPVAELIATLNDVVDPLLSPETLSGAILPDAPEAVLRLPTRDRLPTRSPDLPEPDLADVTEDEALASHGATTVTGWRVPVVPIPPAAAFSLLTALSGSPVMSGAPDAGASGHELVIGGDLRYLAEVAALADDLARRGRVLPAALPAEPPARRRPPAATTRRTSRATSPGTATACWLPVLTGRDAERARDLALALPPVARGPEAGAAQTLTHALDALTDAAVRRRCRGAGLRAPRVRTRGGQARAAGAVAGPDRAAAWQAALTGEDGSFQASRDEVEALTALLTPWQADAVGGPIRALFRLVEPAVDIEPTDPARPHEPGDDPGGEPADAVTQGSAPWTVEFGLQAANEPSLVVNADRIWASRRRLTAFARQIPEPQETLLAELGRALRLYPGLEPALRTARPTRLDLDPTQAHDFLQTGAPSLAAAGFGVLLPSWWGRPGARLGVRARASTPSQPGATDGRPAFGQEALVDFRWEVALDEDPLSEEELAALAELKQPLVRLRGQWVEVDSERLRAGLRLIRDESSARVGLGELLRIVGSGDGGPAGLPVVGVAAQGWLADLLSAAPAIGVDAVPVPEDFVGTLRPYQERGLAWLAFLQTLGLGAVLADDMGLGKTVQLLALMAGDSASEPGEPTLLVCPMSLVGNWQREAAKFAPGLAVHVHHGAERPRGRAFEEAVAGRDLVITTYALVARDASALAGIRWRRVVLDEAQAVKNAATKAAVAVRGLPARHRIAVTGTPVENRLADLWSLMEFANPGLLGSAAGFRKRFAVPIERHADADATTRLRTVTRPFILRRVKTDREIIADLPEKLEMEVVCGLTREQASLYQAVVDDMMARIEGSEGMERRGLVLATMTKLKQVCNHPAQFLKDGSRLPGRSGKLERLEETLEEVLATGEKALLFTQYAEFGGMLRAHLSARFGREVLFLHGGVAKADRDAMVARFQSEVPGGPPLFVLSLKAGGTGLTLTAANHVIHVDRWWNPAVEDQATDRAYRIGQRRNVQVRKLVCGGTLEERISAMIADKRGLAASIVGTGEGWLTELTTDQLRELVRLEGGSVVE